MLKNRKFILYIIVLFALALRLYGINYKISHPDDYITVQAAMHYGIPQITPTGYGLYGLYIWPAFTMVYIQIILQTLYLFIGWILGIFSNVEAFKNLYLTNPHSFHLIGRIIGIGSGIGTVWILYYLAKAVYNESVGLLASLFLSVSFIHSFHSQFIRPDVPATFFIVIIILYCIMILRHGDLKHYIFAGIFSGLGIATKFTTGAVLIPIFVAHIFKENTKLLIGRSKSKKQLFLFVPLIILGVLLFGGSLAVHLFNFFNVLLIRFLPNIKPVPDNIILFKFLIRIIGIIGIIFIAIGILLIRNETIRNITLNALGNRKLLFGMATIMLSFIIFDPLFFLDFKKQIYIFVTDYNFLGKYTYFVGVDSLGFIGNLWWYITNPICWGAGVHILIMAILGVFFSLFHKKQAHILIILFPLIYLIAISFGKYKWERYAVTLMPFVSLYAASFLYILYEKVFRKWPIFNNKAVFFLIIALIILFPTYNILRYDYLLVQKDTRIMSKEWVEKNLPAGSKIGQDAYTGDVSEDLFQITRKFSLGIAPLTHYIENGYQYLLVSDTQYRRYLVKSQKNPQHVEFYNMLFTKGDIIKSFHPRNDLWPYPYNRFTKYHIHISPTIQVYRISGINICKDVR